MKGVIHLKRMILVDDEPLARMYIRESFPWTEWGFEIIAEAQNGAEALELISRLLPDIALIDITMPIMDGLTLLEHLNQQAPNTKCILLTAHRDFTYAQQAMQKGAVGYILKSPINLTETKSALDRAYKELEKQSCLELTRKQQQKLTQAGYYPLRSHFIHQILSSVLTKDDEIAKQCAAIGLHIDADSYILLVCEADQLPAFQSKYPEFDKTLVEYSLLEIVRETLQLLLPGQFDIYPVFFGRFAILLSFPERSPSKEHYKRICREVESQIRDALNKFMNLPIKMSASAVFTQLRQFKSSYTKAESLFIYRFYQEYPSLVYAENAFPLQPLADEEKSWMNEEASQLCLKLSDKSFQRFSRKLQHYLLQMKPDPRDVIHWFQGLQPLFCNKRHLPTWPDFHKSASLFEALRMFGGWYQRKLRIESSMLAARPEIARAMQFIHQHLKDELSLEVIAREVDLSPSHLGHLFKKEIGTSVIDYVLEQRIEFAKKLLAEGRYRNYELAEMAGFRHYSYFSTAFRKLTGTSPNEFRRSVKHAFVNPLQQEE